MNYSNTNDARIPDLLDVLTEAILGGQDDLDQIIEKYDIPLAKIEGLVDLIHGLRHMLVRHEPSKKFARELKRDLLGSERRLPGRAQIAAGVAAAAAGAGVVLFARHRWGDDSTQNAWVPALQRLWHR